MIEDREGVRTLKNYDLIKNMSVEEMAVTIMCPNELGMADIKCEPDNKNCCKCCLEWLLKESDSVE